MELFKTSLTEVLEKTAGIVPKVSQQALMQGYVSGIKLLETQEEVCIVANTDFLKFLSEKMIFEENPSAEVLEDLIKEFANLVVGHAKMIAEERGQNFHISTPYYYGVCMIQDYVKAMHFNIDDEKYCSIFLKV
ncbi:chemotaxis protein CheX [Helicobacter anatolicus]|uniref:chemotaxis protein CheX n=1 Tax=Helicobacter anatolicus TaxID=2905874 RepID=UPI001E42C742|nr:chemotaxis protein CheX [Helicobacter anatolicus]MCE3037891.1 chemotaxis protein CheX [Helicobacter anatolicus]